MEVLKVAHDIERYCAKIAELLAPLNDLGKTKAQSMADYELAIQVAIVSLRDEGIQATLIKDIAKGKCRDKRLDADIAESAYKAQIVKIEAAKSILCAKQSIFRHLDNTGK